jgi:hypothetical protein
MNVGYGGCWSTGLVPCKRIGRNIYFKRVWLDEFIDDLPGITPRQARFNAKKKTAASG